MNLFFCVIENLCYNNSFFKQIKIRVVTARAGNVIGGGDWAIDRLVPDCVRAWSKKEEVVIRNPKATRPWQHIFDLLNGYLILSNNTGSTITIDDTQGSTGAGELFASISYLDGSAVTTTLSSGAATARGFVTLTSNSSQPIKIEDGYADQDSTATGMTGGARIGFESQNELLTGSSGFNLVGTNIVFSSAPASGESFFGVILAGADYLNAGGTFPDGTVAVPSITFSSDTDTGIFKRR